MKITEFDLYKDLLCEKAGMDLTPDQSFLLSSRLNPVARAHGFESIDGMSAALHGVANIALETAIIEAMVEADTSFFRDWAPFQAFDNAILPALLQHCVYDRKLRIWSAGTSTGQEAYSLAMILHQRGNMFNGWDVDIQATDISTSALETARQGLYPPFQVQRGLPVTLLLEYFTQESEKEWRLNGVIREMVNFHHLNLIEPMDEMGQFDVIFCRNVLNGFDKDTRKNVAEHLAKQLTPHGALFIGADETLEGVTDMLRPIPKQNGVYALNNSPLL